jgi:hypothetical protein
MAFLMNNSETKKFVRIFCEAFLILKNILLSPPPYFHFYSKGFLNSQAVRIRVKRPAQMVFFVKSLWYTAKGLGTCFLLS